MTMSKLQRPADHDITTPLLLRIRWPHLELRGRFLFPKAAPAWAIFAADVPPLFLLHARKAAREWAELMPEL